MIGLFFNDSQSLQTTGLAARSDSSRESCNNTSSVLKLMHMFSDVFWGQQLFQVLNIKHSCSGDSAEVDQASACFLEKKIALNFLCVFKKISAKVSISVDTIISLTEKGWFWFVQVSLPHPLQLLRKTVWEDVPSLGSYLDITVFRCLVGLDIIIGRYWPVKHHLCMYISCHLVNGEDRPHSLSWECIFHCIISLVHLSVELQRKLCVRKSSQILYCFLI